MSSMADNRLPSFLTIFQELIVDKENNDVIEQCINRFFGKDVSQLIDDRNFIYNFFSRFIHESLAKEGTDRLTLKESILSQRSKLMTKIVYNYREYQLSLLLVLCEIKINLGLSDDIFDAIIKTFYANRVVSEDAHNHWFHNKSGFEERMKIIKCCLLLLEMSQEAREDLFYLSS